MNEHRDILEFLVEVGVDPHIPSTRLCLDCYEPGAFYALHMAISHSKIKGAAQLLIEKLGAYKTLIGRYALTDEELPRNNNK